VRIGLRACAELGHGGLYEHDTARKPMQDALKQRHGITVLWGCPAVSLHDRHSQEALKDPRKSRFYLDQAVFEARRLNLCHELATAGMVESELSIDLGDYDKVREALEASA
jgi:hypothetical protein